MSTRQEKKILFYVLAALMGGCVPVMSIHPLYNEKDVIYEQKLLGLWEDEDDNTTWEFRQLPDKNRREKKWTYAQDEDPNNTYHLIYHEDENKGSFAAHLVKLDDKMFLDVYPTVIPCFTQEPNECEYLLNMVFLAPLHTFTRIEFNEPQLKIFITNEDKIKDLLKEKPGAVKHEKIKDRRIILTASTKELQKFFLEYADDERLFPGEVILKRLQAADAKEPKAEKKQKEQKPSKDKTEQK